MSRLTREDFLEHYLTEFLNYVETPPEKNCSCHVSPPCRDCVDYSHLRELILDSKTTIEAGTEPKVAQQSVPEQARPEIEYRYTGGTSWCPLGPAEHMKENFDGVYRLKAGKFPVEQAAPEQKECWVCNGQGVEFDDFNNETPCRNPECPASAQQAAPEQATVRPGYVLVPVEPTPVMIGAGAEAVLAAGDDILLRTLRPTYKAMIAAAPLPQQWKWADVPAFPVAPPSPVPGLSPLKLSVIAVAIEYLKEYGYTVTPKQ